MLNYHYILSFSLGTLYPLILFLVMLILSSCFFTIFVTLASDFRYTIPVLAAAAFLPLIFIPPPLNLILVVGSLTCFLLVNLTLYTSLKTYFSFQPNLLSPATKTLTILILLVISFAYYLSANNQIQTKGFELPDGLIDAALKFSQSEQEINVKGVTYLAQLPSLTKEQLELLKQNPNLVRQYGLDPKMLDTLEQPSQGNTDSKQITSQKPSTQLLKNLVKDQFSSLIKPYLNIIPPVLAILFFLTLYSFATILTMFVSPFLWMIFYLLDKTGFIRYEKEMREVKKLVV